MRVDGGGRLDHGELIRRLDGDGMTLPNGRAEGLSGDDWIHLIHLIRQVAAHGWSVTWPAAGERKPATSADLTSEGFATGTVQLAADVDVRVYPSWGTDAFWFDVDARQLRSPADTDALGDFVSFIGRTAGVAVHLSYEGRDDAVFMTYSPSDDAFSWTN